MAERLEQGASITISGLIGLTFRDPRAAARALLSRARTRGAGWLMGLAGLFIFLASYRLGVMLSGEDILIENLRKAAEETGTELPPISAIEVTISLGIFAFLPFILMVNVAFIGAKIFGGGATIQSSTVVAGWAYLVSVLIGSLFYVIEVMSPGPVAAVLAVINLFAQVYLLYAIAAMFAQANGFSSTLMTLMGGVALMAAGGMLLFTFVALLAGPG